MNKNDSDDYKDEYKVITEKFSSNNKFFEYISK